MTEEYEREAEQIARRFYRKDWQKLSGKLREEIYQMAIESVNRQKCRGRPLQEMRGNVMSNGTGHAKDQSFIRNGSDEHQSE